jgi:hypothetical protein
MVQCFQREESLLWIMNDKGRYHSLKSTARGRSCGSRLLAFVATLPFAGRGCSKLSRNRLVTRNNFWFALGSEPKSHARHREQAQPAYGVICSQEG